MVEIDQIDRRILRELQRDTTRSLDEVADLVGLSRNAVWRRVRLLEQAGIIRDRVALLDPEKLGLGLTVFVQVRTSSHDPDWLAKFAHAMRDTPEVLGAYRMTGDLDYLIRARVGSVQDYDRFYQRMIARLPLSDVSASFVMEEIKETTELPV